MKQQLINSIEDFKKKWHLLGYKGWLADTLLAIVSLIGITDDDKKEVVKDVKSQIPIIQLPEEFFSGEEKVIDGQVYKVITVSKEFNDRLKNIENFINGSKELL